MGAERLPRGWPEGRFEGSLGPSGTTSGPDSALEMGGWRRRKDSCHFSYVQKSGLGNMRCQCGVVGRALHRHQETCPGCHTLPGARSLAHSLPHPRSLSCEPAYLAALRSDSSAARTRDCFHRYSPKTSPRWSLCPGTECSASW